MISKVFLISTRRGNTWPRCDTPRLGLYKSRNKIARCWLRCTTRLQGSRIKDLGCLGDVHLGQGARVKVGVNQDGSTMILGVDAQWPGYKRFKCVT